MRYQDPDLRELLAAEYVLGTLTGKARQRFERLLQAHPALRHRVNQWEQRLYYLAESAAAVAPPEETWRGLQNRLFPVAPSVSWYQRLNFWRNLSLASGLVAAVLAVFLIVSTTRETPHYLVMINDTSQQPLWIVSTSEDMGKFYVKSLKTMNMPKDVNCLLWVRPEGSQQLYALGILPDKGDDAILTVDKKMRAMLPGKLLVSVEHTTGALPPKPGGPLVYEGKWMPLKEI